MKSQHIMNRKKLQRQFHFRRAKWKESGTLLTNRSPKYFWDINSHGYCLAMFRDWVGSRLWPILRYCLTASYFTFCYKCTISKQDVVGNVLRTVQEVSFFLQRTRTEDFMVNCFTKSLMWQKDIRAKNGLVCL